MRIVGCLVVVLVALTVAPAAQAVTVHQVPTGYYSADIYVAAAADEANDIRVGVISGGTGLGISLYPWIPDYDGSTYTEISDAGAPITASNCDRISASRVRCMAGPVHMTLGDGDDRAEVSDVNNPSGAPPFNGYSVVVLGGDGNDHLESNGTRAFLAGEGGDDDLIGGDDRDGFAGGAGDDNIFSLDLIAEDVFCGPGDDAVLGDPIDRRAATCERTGLD